MKIPSSKPRHSAATPYARPQQKSTGGRLRTRQRPEPLDFSGVKKGQTAELSTTATSDKQCGFSTPPSLRRASTLPIAEEEASEDADKPAKDHNKLPRKYSSGVEDGVLVSNLRKLESGSIIGNTYLKSSTIDKMSNNTQSMSQKVLASVSSLLKTISAKQFSYSKDTENLETRNIDENSLPAALKESKLSICKKSIQSRKSLVDLDTKSKDTGNQSMDIDIDSEGGTEHFDPEEIPVLRKRSTKEKRSETKINCTKTMGSEDDNVPHVFKEASRSTLSPRRHSSRLILDHITIDTDASDVSQTKVDTAMLPPTGQVEVAISFDTTGSMFDCLDELKLKMQDLIQRLQADIPGIRIAVMAHGDYCDTNKHIIQWLDFGASLPELCDFVKSVDNTNGGDDAECYELVLLRARNALSWTPGSHRALIMINDDVPHEPGYTYMDVVYNIDWREECTKLRDMGVKVYGVQSGDDKDSAKFNEEMARITSGKHLPIQDFSSIFDFIMMICYKEGNPHMIPVYENELRTRCWKGSIATTDDVEMLASKFVTDDIPSKTALITKPSTTRTLISKASTTRNPTLATVEKRDVTRKAKPKSTKAKHKRPLRKRPSKGDTVLMRERLPDSYFNKGELKKYTWTRWTRAIVPELPKTKEKLKFAKCSNYPGFRLKSIFNGDSRKPAIYEFAVQAPGCQARKKHVVYSRKTIGYKTVRFWDLYQLRHKSIQREVERAVSQGCSIWIRRGVLKGRHSVKSEEEHVMKAGLYIKTTIDYAWKKYLWRKTDNQLFHRVVTIKGKGGGRIPISCGDL